MSRGLRVVAAAEIARRPYFGPWFRWPQIANIWRELTLTAQGRLVSVFQSQNQKLPDMDKAKFRYYLFASDGVCKIPFKKIGVALPQYAGTKQKSLNVLYWHEGGAIKTVLRPGQVAFDADGRWDRAHFVEGAMAMINASRQVEAHCWQPTQANLDRVTLDLISSGSPDHRRIPYVKHGRKQNPQEGG